MTSLFLLHALLAFTAHQFPGLVVTPPPMLSPHPEFNCDAEDLDGDGAVDLLFADHVLLQRDGLFPQTTRLPLPELTRPAWLDAAGGALCVLLLEQEDTARACAYERYALEAERWTRTDSRELKESGDTCASKGKASLMPFVHNGMAIYFENGSLNLLPVSNTDASTPIKKIIAPVTAALLDRAPALWPASARNFVVLESGLRARFISRGDSAEMWQWQAVPAGASLIRTSWAWPNGHGALPEATTLPAMLLRTGEQPALLNIDTEPDLVSWLREESKMLDLRLPAMKLAIKLSGQETLWSTLVHAPGAAFPVPRITDLNSDGLSDVSLFTLNPTRNSVRETALQLLTRSSLTIEVQCFLQTSESTYPSRPSARHALDIMLDAPPIQGGKRLDDFASGGLVSLDGDVNGDGLNDLVAHVRSGKVIILAGHSGGFNETPLATLDVPEQARIAAHDINGDGKAEVIAYVPGGDSPALVYFP